MTLPGDAFARLNLANFLERKNPEQALVELRKIPPGTPEHVKGARHVASLSMTRERDYDAFGPLEFLETKFPERAQELQTALRRLESRE